MSRKHDILVAFNTLPDVISTSEYIETDKVQFCIDNMNFISGVCGYGIASAACTLEQMYKLRARETCIVKYRKNNRYIPDSTQTLINVPRNIRAYLADGYYVDADIEACHYNIFKFLCKRYSVSIKNYRKLKSVFTKVDFYKIMYGGDTGGYDEACTEIQSLIPYLLDDYPDIARTVNRNEYNFNGRFLSIILCRIEAVCLYEATNIFKTKHKIPIGGLFYDGFFIVLNAYIREDDKVYQAIFDEIHTHIKRKYGLSIKLKIKEFDTVIKDAYNNTIEPIINERKDPYVQVEDIETKTKFINIDAPLGTGKSTSIRNYIGRNYEKYDNIVIICPRRTYSTSIKRELNCINEDIDFLHYLDTRSKQIKRPYVIIQYESLHRLDYNYYSNTLLIMDECEALLTQYASFATNKKNHSKNIMVFKALFESSKKVIAMDAFMLYSRKYIDMLIQYNIKPVVYKYITPFPTRKRVQLNDNDQFIECLMTSLSKNRRVFSFCSSKAKIVNVIDQVRKRYPSKSIACYYKDTKTTPLIDVNAEWADKDLVICTSCITIGIDCNEVVFDDMFLYASSMSRNLCRDIAQALYRPRQVVGTLYYYIVDNFRNKHDTVSALYHQYTKNYYSTQQTIVTILRENGLTNGDDLDRPTMNVIMTSNKEHLYDIYFIRDSIERILDYCNYEKKSTGDCYLSEEFCDLIQNVLMDDLDDGMDDFFQTLRDANGDDPKDYKNIPSITYNEFTALYRQDNKTETDILKLMKFKFNNMYHDDKHLTEIFYLYQNIPEVFNNVKRYLYHIENKEHFVSTLFAVQKELYNKHNIQYMRLDEFFNAIGFDRLKDYTAPPDYTLVFDDSTVNKLMKKYGSKKAYMKLCYELGIPMNKNQKCTKPSTFNTLLNNILKRYTFCESVYTTRKVQDKKKRIRLSTITVKVKDECKVIDISKIYSNIKKKK